jgi:hypothetical protein
MWSSMLPGGRWMTNGGSIPSPAGGSTGAEEHSQLSYRELDIAAHAIASNRQLRGAAGERVSAGAIAIHRSATAGQPASATDSTSQSGGPPRKKSTPLDRSVWNFVMRTSLGGVDTYLWHRQGSNEFCWRPVGRPWGGNA